MVSIPKNNKKSNEIIKAFNPQLLGIFAGGGSPIVLVPDEIEDRNENEINIYFSVAKVKPGLKKKATKNDIEKVIMAHVDIDPVQDGKYSPGMRSEMLAMAQDADCSFAIDSGNGVGLFWLFDEDVTIDEVEGINKALITKYERYGADKGTHNADRIMRLPGTWNYPSPTKLKKGYPEDPGIAQMIKFTDKTYSKAYFKPTPPKETAKGSDAVVEPIMKSKYTAKHGMNKEAIAKVIRGIEINDGDNMSEIDFAFTKDVIEDIRVESGVMNFAPAYRQWVNYLTMGGLLELRNKLSDPHNVDKPTRDKKYFMYTMTKVMKELTEFTDLEVEGSRAKVTELCELFELTGQNERAESYRVDDLIEYMKESPGLNQNQAKKVSGVFESWLSMRDYTDRLKEPAMIVTAFAGVVEVDPLEALKGYAMTKKVRKKYEELKHLYKGLIVEGYHIYLYGSAGAGKTTIAFHLMIIMAKEHPDKQFVFFYLDGALNMASAMDQYVEELGLGNVMLLTEGSAGDYKKIMDDFVKSGVDLTQFVFFYDTFKYMSRDVNNKNSNKEAMHSIKALNKLGATFITLGHTNKDGKRESGTAELEQDSDALIRVDSMDNEGRITTSLSKGGRCRFDLKEASFSYVAGDPTSVIAESEFTPIDGDKEIIDIAKAIKVVLKDGEKTTIEITEAIRYGRNKLLKVLHDFSNTMGYWEVKNGDKNTKIYFLATTPIDDSY